MMLWTAADPAPNPRRVRLFAKAKGIDLPMTEVAMLAGAHKAPDHLARNPRGQLPYLELGDGRVIAETIAICRYLDELHPDPPLFGRDAFERAETDMWTRRVEMGLMTPVALFWQHGHPFTARLVTQVPAVAELGTRNALSFMGWLDDQLAAGPGPWLAGARLTVADLALLTIIDFAGWIGLKVDPDRAALTAWHARATARFA